MAKQAKKEEAPKAAPKAQAKKDDAPATDAGPKAVVKKEEQDPKRIRPSLEALAEREPKGSLDAAKMLARQLAEATKEWKLAISLNMPRAKIVELRNAKIAKKHELNAVRSTAPNSVAIAVGEAARAAEAAKA